VSSRSTLLDIESAVEFNLRSRAGLIRSVLKQDREVGCEDNESSTIQMSFVKLKGPTGLPWSKRRRPHGPRHSSLGPILQFPETGDESIDDGCPGSLRLYGLQKKLGSIAMQCDQKNQRPFGVWLSTHLLPLWSFGI
jgi:hypothetical protein